MKLLLAILISGLMTLSFLRLPGQEPGQDPKRVAPVELTGEKDCIDCHETMLTGKFVHEPVEEEMCDACHDQPDEALHSFSTPKDLSGACSSCHDDSAGDHIHKPVADGNCMACHDAHHSDNKALLISSDQEQLCMTCHDDQLHLDREFIHGPVDAGLCTICHFPHASNEESLLVEEKMDLCLGCHEDLSEQLDEAENIHVPVDEDCSLCHETHSSDHSYQLLKPGSDLCFECHDDIQTRTELSVGHAAVKTEAGCMNCHSAHHSPHSALLNGQADQVCLSCHSEAVPGKDEKEVPAMSDLLALEFKHGPIQDGNCSACHEPHGSDVFSILREPYPKRFYSKWQPENYSLCFRCHEDNAFLDERTESLTEFRNGDLNLHFLHVNRQRKGRTCRACHETHASAIPHHLAETVPFGGWELPIDFIADKDGGSCAPGCHSFKEYDRVNAKSYEVTPSGKLQIPGISAAEIQE